MFSTGSKPGIEGVTLGRAPISVSDTGEAAAHRHVGRDHTILLACKTMRHSVASICLCEVLKDLGLLTALATGHPGPEAACPWAHASILTNISWNSSSLSAPSSVL